MTTRYFTADDGQRLALISGTIRPTATGWQLLEDAGHRPSGIAGVTQFSDRIEIQHPVGATVFVSSFQVTTDETLKSLFGLHASISAGLDHSVIRLTRGGDAGPYINPTTIAAANGNIWISGQLEVDN